MEILAIVVLLASWLVLLWASLVVMRQRDEARAMATRLEAQMAKAAVNFAAWGKEEQRLVQFLLYASRPQEKALKRIWWGRAVPDAALLLMKELGVELEKQPRFTHGECSAEGVVTLEYTPKAVIKRPGLTMEDTGALDFGPVS